MGKEIILKELKEQFLPQKEKKYKCVQDLIDLPDIMDGMLCLGDGRFIKVMEVGATNFANKEEADQNQIISSFANWLKISPVKCQIKIINRNASENKFAVKLKEKESKCNDVLKKALYDSILEYVLAKTHLSLVKTKYYIIFEFEETKAFGTEPNLKYISAQLNNVIMQARAYFDSMGNYIIEHEDEDIFLGEFLYELLNRQSSKNTKYIFRARRILEDIIKLKEIAGAQNTKPKTDYVNLIAPMGMSLKTVSDAVIADKTYLAYYYVPSSGYPSEVESGWLTATFANMLDVDIDIFYRKINRKEFIRHLHSSVKFTNLKAMSRTTNSKDASDIKTAMMSQEYVKNAMANTINPQDPFYVVTLITVAASSYEELKRRCEKVQELALNRNLKITAMTHYEWLGFLGTLPFNNVPNKIFYKARRNILTQGLAGFYPFTAFELNDEKGIVIGANRNNNSVISLDPFNRNKYANGNILILGGSGKGKTFSMGLLAARTVLTGKKVYIITSEKPHEFKRLTEFLDGTFVKFTGQRHDNINLFDIRPEGRKLSEIYGDDAQTSLKAKKAKAIMGWLSLLFKHLEVEEITALDRAINRMYAEFGIDDDNNSIYLNNAKTLDEKGRKILKEMPIMQDLLDSMVEIKKSGGAISNRLLNVIDNFINGTYSSFNQQTNVNLDKNIIVFDLSDLSETVEAATIHLTLDFVFSKIKEDPKEQASIIIEEGWKYLSQGSSDDSAKQIQEIFKIIRGYGGNVILATQQLADILSSEYGKSVIECSSLKLLLGVEEGMSSALVTGLNLKPAEGKVLEEFSRGSAILIAGKDHVLVQIEASRLEDALLATDPEKIEKSIEIIDYWLNKAGRK